VKGYVYTMFKGADPGKGWEMTDPILKPVPTMGACMPNLRRAVVPGDYVFAISGRVPGAQQYVVGGFRVAEKIDALAAYDRFPSNRLYTDDQGRLRGNVLVDAAGMRNPLDYHAGFEQRIENFLVGEEPIALESAAEVERGRQETLAKLQELFQRTGDRVFDVIGRFRRLDDNQIADLLGWLRSIKASEA
jgi:hypothetical protein